MLINYFTASVIVVHSNDKDVGALRQLGLPIATWELDIEAARPTAKNDVFVIVRALNPISTSSVQYSDLHNITGHLRNGRGNQ